MLYHLFLSFADDFGPFRIFRYPSFRIPAAVLTSLILTLWLFPAFIRYLQQWQQGTSNIREDTPEAHQQKAGTPTMGGLFIIVAVAANGLLWADLSNSYVWAVLAVLVGFGAIGFVDDYRKIAARNSKGLSGRYKILWQIAVLLAVSAFFDRTRRGTFLLG